MDLPNDLGKDLPGVTRRALLRGTGTLTAAATVAACAAPVAAPVADAAVFAHGVASGDPRHDAVVLWTRISVPAATGAAGTGVQWLVARDPALREVVRQGEATTGAWRDWTVKVDVDGLAPDTTWYYRFSHAGAASATGRTRTLPASGGTRLRFAVASCANLPFGWFNVYRRIAARTDLDLVLHLGDYLYEYGAGTYDGGAHQGRSHLPAHEIVSLADYRTRHAQYKADPDLQAAHRQHPFVAIWDDHESANDSWRDGAENHDPATEGDWATRKAAAQQAYFEWMPIRETGERNRTFRSFAFGDLADFVMLDTRLYGRDRQATGPDDPAIDDPARSMLGAEQAAWLQDRLGASQARGARWRIIGQQLMFGHLRDGAGKVINVDQWDGYPHARAALLAFVRDRAIRNVAVLTGDIHSSWAMELALDPWQPDQAAPLAVEFVTPAVTSPAFPDPVEAREREAAVRKANPHMKFVDLQHRGYLLVDVDRERLQAEWYFTATIEAPTDDERFVAAFQVLDGSARLIPVDAPSAPPPSAPPA